MSPVDRTVGRLKLGLVLCLAPIAFACRQDMHDQPRYEPFEGNSFFQDGRADRPQVVGSVARGQLRNDELFFSGVEGGEPATRFPFPITREVLTRGRERYNIYCTACHDQRGYGEGMAVQMGFRQPSSFHIDRLREAPPGYFFGVMTDGFGAMFDYADRLTPRDRWAIAAYIRALQASQNVPVASLPASIQASLSQAQ